MKNNFLSYDASVALRIIGFNKKCLAYFNNNKLVFVDQSNGKLNYIKNDSAFVAAPLISDVRDWFNKRNLIIDVQVSVGGYHVEVLEKYDDFLDSIYYSRIDAFGNYRDAFEQGIFEAIKKL